MKAQILNFMPVLPSADIARDVAWYKEKVGFECLFSDRMYAVLYCDDLHIHLQWHADTEEDPLLGGSVIRIFVKNIQPLLEEFIQRGTVSRERFRANTPRHTNKFGFYDLNNNAIFIVQEVV